MASRLQDIKFGSVDIKDFAYWMNERHYIYLNKETGKSKPWTDDDILRQYKFTNVFRQLDKGTITLREMLNYKLNDCLKQICNNEQEWNSLIFFNICWYRFFNWYEHAKNLHFVVSYEEVEKYIIQRYKDGKKIFTGAHMTTGVAYEDKHISYLRACKIAWDKRIEFTEFILKNQTMEAVFEKLLNLYMVGRFIAYELVCDLRFTPLLENATDKLTWANLGPGAQRGLKRLGLTHKNQQQGLASMTKLYDRLNGEELLSYYVMNCEWPFELREVEHSLCEFDKYCRVKFGEGRPRSKYSGI